MSVSERLAEIVANDAKITVAELKTGSLRRFSHPRQELMAALHLSGGYSFPQIGRMVGGRDHTTVMHAKKVVLARMAEHAEIFTRVDGYVDFIANDRARYFRRGAFNFKSVRRHPDQEAAQ